jgi:hypothetical protein
VGNSITPVHKLTVITVHPHACGELIPSMSAGL